MLQPLRYARLWLWTGLAGVAFILGLALAPLGGPQMFAGVDKVEHFIGFLGLTVWFMGVVDERSARSVALLLLVYGILIEVLQSFTPYRSADLFDVLSDAAGIGAGWLLASAGLRHWCRRIEARLGVGPP